MNLKIIPRCRFVQRFLVGTRPSTKPGGGRLENCPALEFSFLGGWKLKTIVNLKTERFRYASMHNGKMSRGCEKKAGPSGSQNCIPWQPKCAARRGIKKVSIRKKAGLSFPDGENS